MNLRFITPWATDKNIGKAYNEAISELPEDCYVVLRDGDTMFLNSDWGKQIEEIILSNPEYDLITCMTNRLGIKSHTVEYMFDCDSISEHKQTSWVRGISDRTLVEQTNICPGMLMIFHKSLWNEIKFVENSIFFDKRFSEEVLKSGRKIGLAKGLYLLHLYRWGSENPKSSTKHLR